MGIKTVMITGDNPLTATAIAKEASGEEVAPTLIAFVKEYGVTHLVVGRPGSRNCWRRWLRPSLHDLLMQALPDTDLVVV